MTFMTFNFQEFRALHEVNSFCYPLFIDSVKFRLVGGSDANSGRIELNLNGLWGTVCDDEFNTAAAKTVCRQMGLPL